MYLGTLLFFFNIYKEIAYFNKKIAFIYWRMFVLYDKVELQKEVRHMKIYKAYKFRLYLREKQRILIYKTFGFL